VPAGDRTVVAHRISRFPGPAERCNISDVMHVANMPSFSPESTASQILPSRLLDPLSASAIL
jgi:hypothetical protein